MRGNAIFAKKQKKKVRAAKKTMKNQFQSENKRDVARPILYDNYRSCGVPARARMTFGRQKTAEFGRLLAASFHCLSAPGDPTRGLTKQQKNIKKNIACARFSLSFSSGKRNAEASESRL